MRFRDSGDESRIVTLGEVMALFLAPAGVPLGAASRFDLDIAGAEATTAVTLARLGRPVAFVGRVGRDPLGDGVLGRLRGSGVDVGAVRTVPDHPTGLLVRDATADRPVSVLYYRAGSAGSTLCPDDVPDDLVARAGLLHLTGITAMLSDSAREAVLHAAAIARAHGVPLSFDPNVRRKLGDPVRWRRVVEELAGLADVVLTGIDDARVVTDGPPHEWFLERGARVVVTKDGAKGAWETDGEAVVHQPARATRVVDSVGAGDAFAGAWLDGFLAGLAPEVRMARAAAVGALCVGVPGDLAGLPDATTLERVLGAAQDVDR